MSHNSGIFPTIEDPWPRVVMPAVSAGRSISHFDQSRSAWPIVKTLESQYNHGINSRDRYILYQPGAHNEFESRHN
jgi:hypothetical protein